MAIFPVPGIDHHQEKRDFAKIMQVVYEFYL
jgi:hypothetical protein